MGITREENLYVEKSKNPIFKNGRPLGVKPKIGNSTATAMYMEEKKNNIPNATDKILYFDSLAKINSKFPQYGNYAAKPHK